jgi:hypothetical protein
MNANPIRPTVRAATRRASPVLPLLLSALALPAQQALDFKPPPVPDPVKGWPDQSPPTAAEMAMLRLQRPFHAALPTDAGGAVQPLDRVVFDQPGDGRIWAAGRSYKASFGADGFTYVPFLGAGAPRDFPVRFRLCAVSVGGRELALADAAPVQDGNVVTFARGAMREQYELLLDQVEQSFTVDSNLPGDVEVELQVISELAADAAAAGIRFANELGRVDYGAAHVVVAGALQPVPTTFADGAIRIRVPAAQRPEGLLVIDPIIQTSAFTFSGSQDSRSPDIAYDATSDQYLAVWQYQFSATDVDIYCEFRNGDGSAVAGSLGVVDITTISHENPRAANLNGYDRFLVVMQRFQSNVWSIQGRLRLAGQAVHPIVFQINDPALSGNCVNPDVGGDSADTGTCDKWCVVWERQLTATDFDIHGRLVRADTSMSTPTLFIENSAASIYSLPQVSQSNGNGLTSSPRWMVVYQFRFSATDWDVYGCAIDLNGTIATTNTPIDTSTLNDLVPCVSSPNTDFTGNPLFLVTYERQSPLEARARLLSAGFVNQIAAINMTASFGFGPFWVRPESDGNRFAVLTGSATISVGTLAYTGSALVLHEAPQALPGIPSYPRICSKRSGGGPRTDYGIAYIEESPVPDRIGITAYRGHAPIAGASRRVMGCQGLQIAVAGRPFLGESLTFSLANVGLDLPGMAFGLPVPASTTFCSACPLGIDLNAGVTAVIGTSWTIQVPPAAVLVGAGGAIQGFGLGSGPCVHTLRFSDTIDFTVG